MTERATGLGRRKREEIKKGESNDNTETEILDKKLQGFLFVVVCFCSFSFEIFQMDRHKSV